MNEMENDNKDRSDRIDEIAENALELSPGDRAEYLDRQCGDDLELRARVEKYVKRPDRFPGSHRVALW